MRNMMLRCYMWEGDTRVLSSKASCTGIGAQAGRSVFGEELQLTASPSILAMKSFGESAHNFDTSCTPTAEVRAGLC